MNYLGNMNSENLARYMNYWFGIKRKATEEGNKTLTSIALVMLNSFYGKFGQIPLKEGDKQL